MAYHKGVAMTRSHLSTKPLRLQGPDLGYHQNWYAVARSDEVAAGDVIGRDLLGGRVIVFRGADGAVRVMSAYCRHLGADLSRGTVVGDTIRCEFHHWQYGEGGRCTRIPASEAIPERARLFAFPVAERWGLIWAFNGESPLFDVPGFRDHGPEELVWRVQPGPAQPQEPWVMLSNSHDYQHLRILHEMTLVEGPVNMHNSAYLMEHDSLFEMPGGVPFEQRIRVTGTNTIALCGSLAGVGKLFSLYTATPLPDGSSTSYVVSATTRPGPDDADGAAAERRMDMTTEFFYGLMEDDVPLLDAARFRPGILLDADKELAVYFDHVRGFPTADPMRDHL